MRKSFEIALLISILVGCTGLSIGLTFAPCYASLCSEEFFPYETRIHIAFYYAMVASIGLVLLLRTVSPAIRKISQTYLWSKEAPVLSKRISVGGVLLTIWIVGLTLASTGYWIGGELSFWAIRTDVLGGWEVAKIRLLVTGIIGHHVDIVLGLVIIPVSRNSILGRVFELHQSTLLFAHKLLAYLLVVGAFAHGAAYYTFVGAYRPASPDRKEAFEIDNPTLTIAEAEKRGPWSFVTLPSGMIGFLAMLAIVITALPVLRRKSYNTFYYCHIVLSALIFILLSVHASTDFYFLLPGLLLWLGDWAWRVFKGMGGLRKRVVGKLENAGEGWYRISLPVAAKLKDGSANEDLEAVDSEKRCPTHPLQSYFVVFPAVSKIQNHAFTAAKVGTRTSGPVLLFQRSAGKKQKKLDKEWTWKLGAQVDAAESSSLDLDVRVEGPYIPSVPELFTASRFICIVGGTGLTGAYSIALWWLQNRCQQDERSTFTLAWTVRHRETADLPEWRELERMVESNDRFKIFLQVTSEEGRLDAKRLIRQGLAATVGDKEKGSSGVRAAAEGAWVYLSGPEGLLSAGEAACIEVQKDLRKQDAAMVVSRLDFYAAKWEV